MTSAISARGLRKSFGSQTVLDAIDFDVDEGSVFALLGPNGAGKTTAVHILSTLMPADAGTAIIGGHNVATEAGAVRAIIGLTGQFAAVDGLLTGEENLLLMARLRHLGSAAGRRRVDALLDQFDLTASARKPLATYSGGMRRRLDLAMTLVGDPRVIFLDEPTTGLDPRSRQTMWNIVRELVGRGVTIFLTTQYLDEADELASNIAVLDGGRVVASGSPDELKRRIPGGHVLLTFASADAQAAASTLLNVPADSDVANAALSLRVPIASDEVGTVREVLARLDGSAIALEGLSIHTPDLDDVFFALTGNSATAHPATTEAAS
ncbi:ATP-binding cassette domain-containing protein [Subtercola lobariae]|uniref:Daunorubicin resistance protein DrrA family ABC transporter ATP-binding protein n=1 Tax=Subtercola lobariae TaxID=1588641 RepID=A0A917B8I3_9MICO|nr:ATP-binding cassette domain-containing protein [Subtercola lobariae]GGF31484.1 daunorubicin resistance protein DrrA family ABC transporter ATP-binding protein [Subtercola lobariae]